VGGLVLTRRRTPLGGLPPARFGVRASRAGLTTHLTATQVEQARTIAPDAVAEYLIRVADEHGIGWGFRFEGLLPEVVSRSPLITAFIPIGKEPRTPAGTGDDLLDRPLSSLLPAGSFIGVPRRIPEQRDYLSVTTYDPDVLPLDSLLVIGTDTIVVFGWLSSRAFWLWSQAVRNSAPSATTYTAYTSFPAPHLSRKHKQALELAVDTVLRSRSHLLDDSLRGLYGRMPDQLKWAHDELDNVVNGLLGIHDDADDSTVIASLIERYESLAA
jgi:hypothetical protein